MSRGVVTRHLCMPCTEDVLLCGRAGVTSARQAHRGLCVLACRGAHGWQHESCDSDDCLPLRWVDVWCGMRIAECKERETAEWSVGGCTWLSSCIRRVCCVGGCLPPVVYLLGRRVGTQGDPGGLRAEPGLRVRHHRPRAAQHLLLRSAPAARRRRPRQPPCQPKHRSDRPLLHTLRHRVHGVARRRAQHGAANAQARALHAEQDYSTLLLRLLLRLLRQANGLPGTGVTSIAGPGGVPPC